MSLEKVVYTAKAKKATGGRDGKQPLPMASGRQAGVCQRWAAWVAKVTNPEQLFAAGYSALPVSWGR